MAPLPSLNKIRENIRVKVMQENLVKQSNGDNQPLFNAMAIVPENEMWKNIQWLHQTILPAIERSKGIDSAEYKNFLQVMHSVIWAMYIGSAYEKQCLQIGNDKMLIEMYRERATIAERELLKYRTAEQMLTDQQARDYRDIVLHKAMSMLNPGAKP